MRKKEDQKRNNSDPTASTGADSTPTEEVTTGADTMIAETDTGLVPDTEEDLIALDPEESDDALQPAPDVSPEAPLSEITVAFSEQDREEGVSGDDFATGTGAVQPAAATTGAPDQPASKSDPDAKRIVHDVNSIIRESLETACRRVGAYVIDAVCKGDYKAVLLGNLRKLRLFQRITADKDLLIDSRRLIELTKAEALRRHLHAEGMDNSQLTTSHLIALTGLRDIELVVLLADEANRNRYSVRQIKQSIGELKGDKSSHDVGKLMIRKLGEPLRLLDDAELVQICSDKDRLLRDLSAAERRKIRSLIKDGKPLIRDWSQLVENLDNLLVALDES